MCDNLKRSVCTIPNSSNYFLANLWENKSKNENAWNYFLTDLWENHTKIIPPSVILKVFIETSMLIVWIENVENFSETSIADHKDHENKMSLLT